MSNVDPIQRQPASACFISDAGISLLKKAEALSLRPYDDQTEKRTEVWVPGATIGYGHLITQNEWSTYQSGFRQVDAENLLVHDLAPCGAAVRNTITTLVEQVQLIAKVGDQQKATLLHSRETAYQLHFGSVPSNFVAAQPQARCPSGEVGNPCVVCNVAGTRVRICV